jgi:hypothetical protein
MYKKNCVAFLALFSISVSLVSIIFLPVPVHAAASIILNPSSGTPGTIIQVAGKGFSGRLATIYFDDRSIANNIPVSDAGDLNYNLTIPNTYKGVHVLRIADNSNWTASSATSDFIVRPRVAVFPDIATNVTDISVIGNGFSSSEKDIKITWDGNLIPTPPATADRNGTWGMIIPVPKTTKGEHYISVISTTTSASDIDKVKFIVAPYVNVTPLSGPVGTQILFYGWGFRPNEDGVTIIWDGEIILTNIRAELDGSLILDGSKYPNVSRSYTGDTRETVYVPPTTQGRHTIGVYGSSFTPRGTFNDSTFEVIPDIKLAPEPSIKGTQVTIKGAGFAGNENIIINLDKAPTNITATTDSNGGFTAILVIPTVKGKQYSISASGNKGNSAQSSFVSTTDKSLPTEFKLLSPAHGAKFTIFESVGDVLSGSARYVFGVFDYLRGSPPKGFRSSQIGFTWSSDASGGAYYILQVSSDRNFSNIVMEKKISNRPEYNLSENDQLSIGQYSWRIKGADSGGNEGPWSAASDFELISMSTIVTILTVLIIILIVAAIAFGILVAWSNLSRR